MKMMYGPSYKRKNNAEYKSNESAKKSESTAGKSVRSLASATTPVGSLLQGATSKLSEKQ